jgi:pimeloyl-ACP methyl ester carboxylesterase
MIDLLTPANRAIRHLMIARGAESKTLQLEGHAVHCYRAAGEGKGPPIVLLHGLGGSANSFFQTMFLLTKHFKEVWAPDLPGNGFSPAPNGPPPLEEQVKVVVSLLEQQVKDKAFLVGNSLGGAMAFYAAHFAPRRLAGLALISPAGAKLSPARVKTLLSSFDVQNAAQARALTERLFHKAPLYMLLFSNQLKHMYSSKAVRSAVQSIKPEDFVPSDLLQNLAMPTLLIWGKSERLLPYESIDYFKAHLPKHAEVQEVEGFGHIPQMEKPAEVARRLIDFARRKL